MRKYVQPGDHVRFTNAGLAAIAHDEVIAYGHRLAVAVGDIAVGATGELRLEGVMRLPKVSGAVFAAGERLTWNNTLKALDDSMAVVGPYDIPNAAIAVEAGTNGQTTCIAVLSGGWFPDRVGTINAFDYDVDPTGVNDSAAALNAAILDAIAEKRRLFVPPGIYGLNSPLAVAVGLYQSVEICGASGAGTVPESIATAWRPGTVFVAGFTDKPAIYTNTSRGVVMRDFAVLGGNTKPTEYFDPTDTQADYVGAESRSTRYSPYCGIAIDPLNVATPADGGYPGMTYSQNVGAGSSHTVLDNVFIRGFVVGIAHACSGAQQNADHVKMRRVRIMRCDTGLAVGHAQAKISSFRDGSITQCREGFNGLSYGAQQGVPPVFSETEFGYVYRLFACSNAFGPLTLDNCFAESFRTFGQASVGASTARSPVRVRGGSYKLRTAWTTTKLLPPLLLESNGPTKFDSVPLTCDVAMEAWNFAGGTPTPTVLEGCTLTGRGDANFPPLIGITDTFNQGVVRINDVYIQPTAGSAFRMSDILERNFAASAIGVSGRLHATPHQRSAFGGAAQYQYVPGDADSNASIGGCSAHSLNVNDMTFTTTSATSVAVGDVFLWQMKAQGYSAVKFLVPALKVTGIVGNDVTCSYLFDSSQYDTVANYAPASMQVAIREWAPTQSLTGDTSSGSPTLSNVSPTTILKNGDVVVGAGIPAFTRVVSGGGTATITLSKNATATATGVAMYYGRLHTPTTSAAF